jgi:hypothetical protein
MQFMRCLRSSGSARLTLLIDLFFSSSSCFHLLRWPRLAPSKNLMRLIASPQSRCGCRLLLWSHDVIPALRRLPGLLAVCGNYKNRNVSLSRNLHLYLESQSVKNNHSHARTQNIHTALLPLILK